MARTIYRPSKDFASRKLRSFALSSEQVWWKLHLTTRSPVWFSCNPGHRFSPAGLDVLYLGQSVFTCIMEVFGDELLGGSRTLSLAAWTHRTASRVKLLRPLAVCNLASPSVRTALGCDLSALMHTELAVPQAWAKALYDHSAGFHGLRYVSRFTNLPCLALFAGRTPVDAFCIEESVPLLEHPDALAFLEAEQIALV
ncbi:MAG: RES family NAD+ phosphorylase [Verrucomicrobiales bacterium]